MEEKIVATNNNIKDVVKSEIKRLGNEAELNHIDVSGVTDMYCLFKESKFNGDISNWDVSNVEVMDSMFYKSPFNGDISNWNVGKVRDMSFMFYKTPFNRDISKWDVSNVENMGGVFFNSKFNQDISKWNVGNVVDMRGMFLSSKFNQDISSWNVGNVENMYEMFLDSPFNKNIDMWNYNFKFVEKAQINFNLKTTGSYTLIEKYARALQSEKFDLADRIKFKMKGIRFNYRYKDIEENKHLVTLDSHLLKEFKEYLWKRG